MYTTKALQTSLIHKKLLTNILAAIGTISYGDYI